ncbi:MAG: tRNA uridine(34) 5-carboxymethylaminomethyl modification radical SAM/GNAT enzyme Elp3, partial [Candidatus Nanohaloarchaea archaeon]|nr:tRNA uridine(34) 5-carboxymethylaminomethyl modification radical SAM/GNAT enzyme Elp3 [Candidatus Nanohaloarchaea archaeon]
ATIAVMWMWDDFSCPYDCVYCPQGEHDDTTAPKSYTGKEPSARRAIDNAYDPYDQVSARLEQLESIGHPTDKSEIIIMGGTFPSTPEEFQEHFIKRTFDALNGEDADDLEEAKQLNETAANRNVGLTIETRPDFTKQKHVNDFLRFGCTRVEMGVQTLDDAVQETTERGHGTEAVVEATQRLKDCGFKLTYHMMLGLPGESRDQDIEKFRTLFEDPRFQPDELKIYPTAVVEGTKLHEMMENGEYDPLTEEEMYERLERIMPSLPPYVRVKRIMRDIPSTEIDDGASRTNARQLLNERMDEKGLETREIRSREAGHRKQKDGVEPDGAELVTREYDASGGTEQFLSFEDVDKDILLGYLRLRFPGDSMRDEIDGDTAIVRQLQVVGPAVPLDDDSGDVQHSGYGKRLMGEAEERAREAGYEKLAVISAVGTREYYRKLGYERDGPYMSKQL